MTVLRTMAQELRIARATRILASSELEALLSERAVLAERRARRTTVSATVLPPAGPRSGWALWNACCAGREPAESLDWRDREDLVAALWERGWPDSAIADLTRMSRYTTARIRSRRGAAQVDPDASRSQRLGWTQELTGGAA